MGPARTPPLRAQRPERRVDREPLAREAGDPHPRPHRQRRRCARDRSAWPPTGGQRWGRGTGARIARRRVPRPQSFPAPSTMWAGPRRGPTEPAAESCAERAERPRDLSTPAASPARWGPARTQPLRAQRPERRVDGGAACARSGGPPSSPPSSTATMGPKWICARSKAAVQRWGRGTGGRIARRRVVDGLFARRAGR
jgi:hypothetical protein